VSRFELGIAAATLVGVVALGVLQALAIAVALSILDVVRRSAQPRDAVVGWVDRLGRWGNVELHPSARVTPGAVVYRLDDRLFFANARYVKGRVREALRGAPDEPHWLVFDTEAVSHVEATGVEALREFAVRLPRDGVGPVVARMKPSIHEVLGERRRRGDGRRSLLADDSRRGRSVPGARRGARHRPRLSAPRRLARPRAFARLWSPTRCFHPKRVMILRWPPPSVLRDEGHVVDPCVSSDEEWIHGGCGYRPQQPPDPAAAVRGRDQADVRRFGA
jgi:hypothetical protein